MTLDSRVNAGSGSLDSPNFLVALMGGGRVVEADPPNRPSCLRGRPRLRGGLAMEGFLVSVGSLPRLFARPVVVAASLEVGCVEPSVEGVAGSSEEAVGWACFLAGLPRFLGGIVVSGEGSSSLILWGRIGAKFQLQSELRWG